MSVCYSACWEPGGFHVPSQSRSVTGLVDVYRSLLPQRFLVRAGMHPQGTCFTTSSLAEPPPQVTVPRALRRPTYSSNTHRRRVIFRHTYNWAWHDLSLPHPSDCHTSAKTHEAQAI
ncbi:unnamed protein product [Pleuronectes platessa]|uniref:Uncharacterized protein n=1 Tax=Pleuronectes platessa TaxID=8262 RepID=A0A9N7ZDP3_PLEPL|nr:unnamed protein product [Pleuronectes platessa]